MYVRINIFNCINASKNDCKLVPSVPGFAVQVKCKANAESNLFAMLSRSLHSPLQLACDGKVRYNKPWIDGFKKAYMRNPLH